MSYDICKCEHIKTNGVRCGSPALRDEKLCYFHHRARRDFPHRAELAADPKTPGGAAPFPAGEGAARHALEIPFPEDADAIQYGLGKVIYGLLNGLIDHKSAGLVLYALQTASGNLKNTSLFKRSQKADEEDRTNVSPLLAYYLGPSREDYSRVLRILQDAEADLQNKTREIADLKQRLGEPCEEDATADAAPKQSSWVERMHEAAAIEPREERYPRNEDIHSAYVARRSVGPQPGSPTERSVAQPPSGASVRSSADPSGALSERSRQTVVIQAQEDQRVVSRSCATTGRYARRNNLLLLRCNDGANSPTQAKTGLEWATIESAMARAESPDGSITRSPDGPITQSPVPRITASISLPFTIGSP